MAHTHITVNLPFPYYTNTWFLCEDGLVDTIADLKVEILDETGGLQAEGATYRLDKDAVEMTGTDNTHTVLSEGDTIDLVEV
jgi:hypothetical protein